MRPQPIRLKAHTCKEGMKPSWRLNGTRPASVICEVVVILKCKLSVLNVKLTDPASTAIAASVSWSQLCRSSLSTLRSLGITLARAVASPSVEHSRMSAKLRSAGGNHHDSPARLRKFGMPVSRSSKSCRDTGSACSISRKPSSDTAVPDMSTCSRCNLEEAVVFAKAASAASPTDEHPQKRNVSASKEAGIPTARISISRSVSCPSLKSNSRLRSWGGSEFASDTASIGAHKPAFHAGAASVPNARTSMPPTLKPALGTSCVCKFGLEATVFRPKRLANARELDCADTGRRPSNGFCAEAVPGSAPAMRTKVAV
mmetsp:Transcript_60102/g.143221  ORF Transcript_60102/g.143221 Transcript_60102/m.143221 type:complete len:315 (+) Transcript_60102:1886-2830(+)